jgi:hypothetical protein
MSGLSDYIVNETLQRIKDECWIGLQFDNPNVGGAYASEIAGGGYSRQEATFGAISNRTMWMTSACKWDGLKLTKIVYITGWDAEFKGNMLFSTPLLNPARIIEGGGYRIAANTLAVSFA